MIVAIMTTALTASAAEEVYSTCLFGADYNLQSVGSYTMTWTATNGDFTWSIVNGNNNSNGWSYVKFGRKNTASVGEIVTSEAYPVAITKVDVTIDALTAAKVNSIKLYTSSNGSSWTVAGTFSKATGTQTVNLANPTTSLYYKIEFDCASGSSNGLVTVSKVEYYYNTGGAVDPSITAADLSIAYDATEGEIEYTINNPVTGGTLSASTNSDWLELGEVDDLVPFECDANSGAERTATVTLTYTYGNESVTKDVTITQAANPNGPGSEANPYTVAQARAAIDAGTGLTDVYATGIISQVDSYNSTYNSITYWISDDGTTTDQLEVYSGKGLDNTNFTSVNDVAVGATVVVYGTLKKFNETYEFDKNNYLTSYTAPVAAVEAPTFSPAAGTYTEAQSVTLSTTTSGATIYYTTDGTEPTNASTQYTGAISVSTTTTIKAIAIKGSDESTVTTATYHFCSAENPYTVTQALAFNEYPANGIYVTGIVSTAPTQTPTSNGQLTYYISVDGEATNQLEVYKGKGLNQAAFEAQDDIQVGDIVTIYGNVKIYNGTKEFDTDNYLVAFERPAVPAINADNVTIAYDVTSGSISYTIDNEVTGTSLTATTEATWLTLGTVGEGSVPFTCSENDGDEDRTATVTLTYGEVTKNVTVTQAAYEAPVADYATLPFSWAGGVKNDLLALAGVTANDLGSDYAASNAPYNVKFDTTGDYIQVKTDSRPGIVTIGVKMLGGASASTITVQESADGETFSDVQALTISGAQNDVLTLSTSTEFAETSRYVRLYFTKGSNVGVGPISIAAYAPIVLSDYTLTIENPANVTITANYGEEVLTNGEEAEVTQGTEVTLAITPASGYDFESLTIEGAEEGQTVTPTEAGGVYTFSMPAFDVTVSATVVEHVEPATASYVLATSITSGKCYVIASGTEGSVKVMGNQANNNRPAVDATITDGVLSVSDEYEFVIESATVGEATGYSIYDEDVPGYLYAASSSSNYLRTQAEIDVNGLWNITIESDGSASVKAEGSSNRNVMQYNSSSTLFSCYASASQKPVYLYEKVEATPADNVEVNIAIGYSTLYYGDRNLVVPADVEAYTYKVTNKLEVSKTYEAGDVIPAGTAVVLKAANGSYTFEATTETGEGDEDNALKGSDEAATTTGGTYYYALSLNSSSDPSSVGFYWMTTGGAAFTCGAHKAYLALDNTFAELASGGVKGFIALPDDDATAISTVESFTEDGAIYNLAGQRLQKMQKGINIVNGKKILK